jgi:membrane protease subunit HflK
LFGTAAQDRVSTILVPLTDPGLLFAEIGVILLAVHKAFHLVVGGVAMARRIYQPEQFDLQDLPWRKILRYVPLVLVLYLAMHLGWRCFYTVEPHEQAVVLRFGKVHAVVGPGLHFMIPEVDEAIPVNIAEDSLRLPMTRLSSQQTVPMRRRTVRQTHEEPLMLTGDLNAAVVEWTIQWRVVDPTEYVFSIYSEHIKATIHSVAQSVMHQLIGDYSIDEVLTGKREEVGLAGLKATQATLDSYKCGIQITGLQMQRVSPPERVKPSFDKVNASIQLKDKLVNEANRERNQLIPQAEATSDGMIREAEGYASRRRAEATGEISALLAKYEAYRQAPDVTRQRLYLEAMQEVFLGSGPKTIVDESLKGLVPFLELGTDGGRTVLPQKKGGQK